MEHVWSGLEGLVQEIGQEISELQARLQELETLRDSAMNTLTAGRAWHERRQPAAAPAPAEVAQEEPGAEQGEPAAEQPVAEQEESAITPEEANVPEGENPQPEGDAAEAESNAPEESAESEGSPENADHSQSNPADSHDAEIRDTIPGLAEALEQVQQIKASLGDGGQPWDIPGREENKPD